MKAIIVAATLAATAAVSFQAPAQASPRHRHQVCSIHHHHRVCHWR